MGFEYQITCEQEREAELKKWLLGRGGKVAWFQGEERFEFRFEESADDSEMPNVTVVLEDKGIYFCFHGGDREKSAAIFMGLIDEALDRSDSSDSVSVKHL
jgi:hypothetical protein